MTDTSAPRQSTEDREGPDERSSRRRFLVAVSGVAGGLIVGGLLGYFSGTPTMVAKPTVTFTRTLTETRTLAPTLTTLASTEITPVTTKPPATLPSAVTYANFDPRDPSNFSIPLRLPGPSEGLFGIVESPSNVSISVKETALELIPGTPINLLAYEMTHNGKSVINPIIKLKRQENLKASLLNGIPQKTIVHWHGLSVDWKNDGHPSFAIDQGRTYDYDFTVNNRGGTYWYHPHPDPAAEQLYRGLASFFIIEDSDDETLSRSLDLQLGTTDIPMLIQDKRFHEGGQLTYDPDPYVMEPFMGFLGDMIMVNLTPNPYLEVDTRVYRFRILNGSTARIFRLAFLKDSERIPFYIIGVDAGLLEKPQKVDEAFVAPAERVDVLLDLRDMSPGDIVFLRSLEFDPMHREDELMRAAGMVDMKSGSKVEDGKDFYVLKLVIKNKVQYDAQIPEKLSVIEPTDISSAMDRPVTLSASMWKFDPRKRELRLRMQWLINGAEFDVNSYPMQLTRNRVEVWRIMNSKASMPHPMHIHGYSFQVLERTGSPPQVSRLAVDSSGRIPTDLGWKDTVLTWPGETVKIAIDFSNKFAGRQTYLFHCHNSEHMDTGMMINFLLT